MLLPPPKTAKAPAKSALERLRGFVEPFYKRIADRLVLPRGLDPRHEARRHRRPGPCLAPVFQRLEDRRMFYITVQNDGTYTASNTATYSLAAPGVLANDTDTQGYALTAHLSTQASHGTVTLNGDGSLTYVANAGYTGRDSATYYDTDTHGNQGSTASITFNVQYGVLQAVDSTKIALDTIQTGQQILGSSSGAPGTAQNLSLVYDSEAGHPDQVLEGDYQLSMIPPVGDSLNLNGTFNTSPQGPTAFATSNLNVNDPSIHVAMQFDTSSLSTGRYPYSLSLSGGRMYGTSTINGFANVVNDAASPVGMGWDIPGVMHVYQNTVQGVPAGVLLTDGSPDGSFFTQGSGNSYTSPNGPYAFDTMTSVTGGGWQLVDKYGTTFNFDSSGYLTSRVARTGETDSYTWTSGLLTSIIDNFNRSVTLGYTNGLLSSITNFAGSVWTIGHTGSELTSITEPNAGYDSAPSWQYAYSGNYLSSVTDADSNATSFTLDGYDRLKTTTLPNNDTIGSVAEADFGYGGSSQFPANGTLTSSVLASTTDPNGNTSYYRTDAFGDDTFFQDAYGNQTTITRDANGLATQITLPPPTQGAQAPVTNIYYDSLGNETYAAGAEPSYGTYVYNTFSEPTSFTDSLNNEWMYLYDTHGNLTSESDPLNNSVTFTVDSFGYPLTMTEPAPNDATGTVTTTYTRDQYERLTKITWPDTTFRTVSYNTLDLPTSVTDEDNHTTTTNYDVLSRITSVVNAMNGTVSYAYSKCDNLLTTTDEMGNVTTDQWNNVGELVQQTLPAPVTGGPSPVLSFTYDADANCLTYADALNRATSYAWDKLDRMTEETLPPQTSGGTNPTITAAYDNLSREISETNELGAITSYAYANTDVRQLTSETLPAPAQGLASPLWSYSYNTLGQLYQTTDPMGHNETETFNADGQVTSDLDNLGHGVTYVYGNCGELLSEADSISHTTSYEYDSRYRLVQTTDPNGAVTSVTLDGVGNTTKLVDSMNNSTSWAFDPLNRPTSETNALGTTTTSYDASSDVTSIADADGRVRNFTYDDLHRLTAEQWMNGSTVVAQMSYAYDLDNELTSASDPNSAYAFAYNGDGEVTTTDNSGTPNIPHVVLSAGYDLGGDMTSQSATINGTPDFLNNYSYNGDQELTVAQQQQQTGGNTVANKEVDLAYNLLGQVISMADYNTLSGPRTDVLTGAYSYDSANRLTGLSYTSDGGANQIDAFGWTYNAGNLVTQFTSNDGAATYGYDPANQLTSASYTTNTGGHQPGNESYSFDLNGNRNSTGYGTGSDNLMTSDGTFNYQYDADGNRTVRTRISSSYASDYRTTCTWDYRNRLTDVDYYDNNNVLTKHVHYVYDVFNDLIGEEDDDSGSGTYDHQEWYADEGGQPVLQFDGNGNLTVRYFANAEEHVTSLNQPGTVYWMAADDQGSVRDVVDNNGSPVDHIVYTTFGQTAYESNSSIPHFDGYSGEHTSAGTSLILMGARWYDAGTGGWLSQDPISFGGGDANLSDYVHNDPTNLVDSSGLAATGSVQWTLTGSIGSGPGLSGVGVHIHGTPSVAGLGSFDVYSPLGPSGLAAFQPWSMTMTTQAGYGDGSDWLDNSANFAAGFGDSLTFGGTNLIRGVAGVNDGIDHGSGWYQAGEAVEIAGEIVVTGGGAGLRHAAARVSHKAVGRAARNAARRLAPGAGGQVHHVNTLFGHPAVRGGRGWRPSLFPLGGLPQSIHTAPWNLARVTAAQHAVAHRMAYAAELGLYYGAWPGLTAIRGGLNAARSYNAGSEQGANSGDLANSADDDIGGDAGIGGGGPSSWLGAGDAHAVDAFFDAYHGDDGGMLE